MRKLLLLITLLITTQSIAAGNVDSIGFYLSGPKAILINDYSNFNTSMDLTNLSFITDSPLGRVTRGIMINCSGMGASRKCSASYVEDKYNVKTDQSFFTEFTKTFGKHDEVKTNKHQSEYVWRYQSFNISLSFHDIEGVRKAIALFTPSK